MSEPQKRSDRDVGVRKVLMFNRDPPTGDLLAQAAGFKMQVKRLAFITETQLSFGVVPVTCCVSVLFQISEGLPVLSQWLPLHSI